MDILPLGRTSKVRSIQVHGKPVSEALAGQRSALNLPDIKSTELERGDVVCTKNLFKTTQCLDVKLILLSSAPEPLKHWQQVHFHIGTSEVMARVALLSLSLIHISALASDGEIIISRGELIEIGESFRIPDIMALSGAKMVEVLSLIHI